VVVVATASVAASAALRGRGAASVSEVSLPQPGAVPIAYHAVYQVTAGSVTTTEELWVHRPFESEDITSSAAGQQASRIVYRLGRQLLHDAGGLPAVFEPSPAPAPFDVRLDAVAAAATRAGALIARAGLTVAGRRCRVYRSAQSLESAQLSARPTAADHVDTCVDAQGLVLDERHVSGGKLVLERRATTVTAGADAMGHAYATIGTHVPLDHGGGRVVTVSQTSRPPGQPFWELAQSPRGFVHLGRFAAIPPPPQAPGQSRTGLVTAVDDVFVRDADVIVVEQGETVGGVAFQAPTGGTEVDLGQLGRGQLVLSPLASSLTALVGKSSFVRVSGTVPPGELLSVAGALTRAPGTALEIVPDLTSDGP